MKKNLMSTTVRYALGTVIGFATLVSMMGTSLAQAFTTITSPNGKDISNVVLYVKTSSGITKVKIDNFSNGPSTTTYNPTSILQKEYPNSQLVAYTVKAGNNKSEMGPGEGELIVLDDSWTNKLPEGASQKTFQYTEVLKLAVNETPKTDADAPPKDTVISNDSSQSQNQESPQQTPEQPKSDSPSVTQVDETPIKDIKPPLEAKNAVAVPEPATVAALGIFGLSVILKGKKKS